MGLTRMLLYHVSNDSTEMRSRPNRIIVVYNNPSIMLSGNNLNYLNNLSKGNRLSGR